MAQQVVTVTKVETSSGANDRGPWTRYSVEDAGGNKYQTFNDVLGEKARSLLNQSVSISFHEETRGKYTNNVIDAIEATSGGAYVSTNAPSTAIVVSPQAVNSKDESIARAVAFKGVIELAAGGVLDPGWDPDTLIELSKFFEAYLLTGEVPVPEVPVLAEDGVRF